jgi:hypothetical protein
MWVQHHSQHHEHHSSWKSNPSTFCLDASHPYVIKCNRNRLHASALPAQAPPTAPPGSAGALPLVLHASTVILVLVARSTIGSGGDACITVRFNVPDIVGEQWCGRQELEEEKGSVETTLASQTLQIETRGLSYTSRQCICCLE